MKSRLIAVMVGCALFALAVVLRAGYVQLWGDPRLASLAKRQFQSKVLVRPHRGLITDRNGESLAVNAESQSLAANPTKVANRRMLTRLLAKSLNVPRARLLERLSSKHEFVWIKRHLTAADLVALKRWGVTDREGGLTEGLWMVKESRRVYPHGELAAHVLGDVNLDTEGMEGVELWQDAKLKGTLTSFNAIKDALGRPAFIDNLDAQSMHDGETVQLTLDATLQFAVEQELRNAVVKTGAQGGSVLAMNADTGEILAMANEPTFNPNASAPADHRRNRILTDGYEPGSTLKAVLLAGALSKGMKLTDQLWGERGSFTVGGKKISEAEAKEKFEWVSLKKMIQVSSNVVAAKLALKIGSDQYLSTLKSFGLGEKTHLGFPGEISGRLPPRPQWTPLTLANIGFGQGILVTPLQMARAFAVIANGGMLVQPRIIANSPNVNAAGPVASKAAGPAVEAPRRVISAKVAEQVGEALHSVTQEGGTGGKARVAGYEVAGKTGTAQEVDPATGKYSRSRYVASFIGYALNVEPKIVIFTSIHQPRGVYYAAETAAPLFSAVLNAVATRFSLPGKDTGGPQLVANQTTHPGAVASTKSTQANALAESVKVHGPLVAAPEPAKLEAGLDGDALAYSAASPERMSAGGAAPLAWQGRGDDGTTQWKMPDLRGLTAREAIQAVQGHRFKMHLNGIGVVASQSPEPGHPIPDSGSVALHLAEPK